MGSLERGPSNESGVVKKWQFSLLSPAVSSEPSQSRPQLLYCTIQPVSGSSLTPKQTNLNGHFTLKSVLGSPCNGLVFWLLEKAVLKCADLSIQCILTVAKMYSGQNALHYSSPNSFVHLREQGNGPTTDIGWASALRRKYQPG